MKMKLKTKNDKSNKHEKVNRKIKARQATGIECTQTINNKDFDIKNT